MGLVNSDCYDYEAQLTGGGEGDNFFDIILCQCANCCE